jgi:hypothetical protein
VSLVVKDAIFCLICSVEWEAVSVSEGAILTMCNNKDSLTSFLWSVG